MNALCVTVSIIPIILVFAGFNHAHGLTTFGKSNNQGPVQTTIVGGKPCTNQNNCTLIKGTTCLRQYCLCGDNSHPLNGICKAQIKGPNHICQNDNECVDNAVCVEPKDKKSNNFPPNGNNNPILICQCTEGLFPNGGQCSGAAMNTMLPGLVIFVAALAKVY
ncbi:uncharacterized protein LOC130898006 [Diorhabda carinulata]|uniref:uncharacterized protein LOC130450900 n=1 Tax=Diorhabda sublineata TaxID=1163346 RepID=UPI0024E14BE6|nr:uncharacterized protein LOC130450900 [Diorhabda sublineata]XP_057663012.1 uncharacterized protein LOC130898006 [Diorhabda carinulata]